MHYFNFLLGQFLDDGIETTHFLPHQPISFHFFCDRIDVNNLCPNKVIPTPKLFMMNFTSSVSDLESLLLKFKLSQDFTNALKVSNMLDIVVSRKYYQFLSCYMMCSDYYDVFVCSISTLEIKTPTQVK